MKYTALIFLLLLLTACNSSTDAVVNYMPPDHANYQHEEVDIRLENGDLLVGSFTFQSTLNKGSPLAILITGSSPHDRDNSKPEKSLDAYRPFRQIAHLLSSHGISVLRMDDRGVGKSKGGHIERMDSQERARDIEQCISYIKHRPEVDSSRICLIGLSEGASIAHMIASGDESIKTLVLLSAIGSKGNEIIEYQVRNGLLPANDLSKILRKDRNMRFLYDYDPLETIRMISQPVLIINGQTDRRVPAKDAYLIAKELGRSGNDNVTLHVLPDHNHALLKEDSSGYQSSYGKISSMLIPDDVLELFLNWIQIQL